MLRNILVLLVAALCVVGCDGLLSTEPPGSAPADAAAEVDADVDRDPPDGAVGAEPDGGEPGVVTTDADIDRLEIEELSRDRVIFDGGTHRGHGYADIVFPLSASDDSLEGETIQMLVRGADGERWVDIGEIHDRALTATVRHPRTPEWQTPTFRIRGGDGRTKSAVNRFAVGSVMALWGQSDLFHVFYLSSSSVLPPPVENEDCLEVAMIHQRGAEPQPDGAGVRAFVTNDWPGSLLSRARTMPPALAEAANAVHRAGGFKTLLLLHLQSGKGLDDQALENGRYGDDERQIHHAGITDEDRGQRVGYVHYFFSSGSPAGWSEEEVFAAAVFGIDTEGRALSFPAHDIPLGRGTTTVRFSMGELYDWSYARLSYMAPYRGQAAYLTRLAAMAEDPVYADLFVDEPVGQPASGFVKGENDGTRDAAHPALDTPYGAQRAGKIYIHDMLRRSGASPGDAVFAFDTIELHPNGDRGSLAIGWSGGDLTTPHLADGRPRLDGRPDVRRFALGDTVLNRVYIRDDAGDLARRGRIWLEKNDGSDWSADDVRRLTYWVANQSSSSTGEDVRSGWHRGHYLAVTIDGGYAMARYEPRLSDFFARFTAYAPR